MIVGFAESEWGRLVPVAIVCGVFAFAGWIVLPRLPKLPRSRRGRRYVEVAACWTTPEANELAQRLRDAGVAAAADSEERPADMGSVLRTESLDGRPFVAVPREEQAVASALIAQWREERCEQVVAQKITGGVFAAWGAVARWGVRIWLLLCLVSFAFVYYYID